MDATEFSERLKAYQAAVESEFTEKVGTEEAAVALAKTKLFTALPDAIDEIVNASKNGKNEGTRLNASKYIVDACTSAKGFAKNDDPFSSLFAALQGITPQPNATASEVTPTD